MDDLDRVNSRGDVGVADGGPHVRRNAKENKNAEHEKSGEDQRGFPVVWKRPGPRGRHGSVIVWPAVRPLIVIQLLPKRTGGHEPVDQKGGLR